MSLGKDKIWLVAGGAPLTYSHLAAVVRTEAKPAPTADVTGVLVTLTRALYRGERVALAAHDMVSEAGISDFSGTLDDESVAAVLARLSHSALQEGAARVSLQTSGTTRSPRAMEHDYRHLARAVVVAPRHRDDVWAMGFNPAHMGGVQVYLQALANLNALVNVWRVPRDEAWDRLRRWNVTHLAATPTFLRMLLPLPAPLPHVRAVSIGGELLDTALCEQLRVHFPAARLRNIYATTEAGTLLVSDGVDFAFRPEDAGRLKIEASRLWVHGSLLGCPADTQWFDTGDEVQITDESPLQFRFTGRQSASINIGGAKVVASEVEDVLGRHPGVKLAQVFARPNSVTGALLCARVVRRDGAIGEAELRAYLSTRVPGHMVPRWWSFVERFEVGATGKMQREVAWQ